MNVALFVAGSICALGTLIAVSNDETPGRVRAVSLVLNLFVVITIFLAAVNLS